MTKQILPNGLYHIKSSIDETLTLTLKKLENEEETTLQFEPINEKNDNQLFYLKYQQKYLQMVFWYLVYLLLF